MPESKPEIYLNEDGVCNLCVEYRQNREKIQQVRMVETDFIKILNKHKGRQKYDCLAMCSGGKDSTSALYFMKKRYKLNPLAFTFDHGFETDEAVANVKRAVDALDVDFMYFKSNDMKNMFRKILETDSSAVICHPCSMWYIQLSYDIARKFDIPLIIAGWTKGQSDRQSVCSKGCGSDAPEFAKMARATKEFIAKHVKTDPQYRDFPSSMDEVIKKATKKHKAMVLSPHWFLPYGQEEYVKIIEEELGWKQVSLSYPANSTNCLLNYVSVYNSMKHFGYTHYHVEMSKLIREGMMTREQALHDLAITFDKDFVNSVCDKLGFKFDL